MIRFNRSNEPPSFDTLCRQPGLRHIANGGDYWRDFWSPFCDDLGHSFNWLCGYSVIRLHKGTVDHFIFKGSKPSTSSQPHLAYEWSNYRFADGTINNLKGQHAVLDPFEVHDSWFSISIPSLTLEVTGPLSPSILELAKFTIDKLQLHQGPAIMRLRSDLFDQYVQGHVDIIHVRRMMPMLADALAKRLPPTRGNFYR